MNWNGLDNSNGVRSGLAIPGRPIVSRQPATVAGLPAKTLKVTAFELPALHTPEHDEWLLDEALAETFPASDPIAISSDSPGSDTSP